MSEDRPECRGKTFKSGNLAALRLPKGLGVPEGTEVRLVKEDRMTFRVEPVDAAVLEAFVATIPLLAFDEAAAWEYARLPFKRARFDRVLAAHALNIDATVVTNNEEDFTDVPGLKVENWTV